MKMNKIWKNKNEVIYKSGDLFLTRRSETLRRAKVYVNNQLKYIMTEEGYIEKATGSNTYTAHYYLNDHLGSNWVVMDAAGTVKQVNNFYPSGTSIAEYPRRTDQGVQPWKFEGKELDRTNNLDFYDFEARAFDPVLMRFNSIDPLAEKYPGISPYVFCANNPVRYVDPTGMYIIGTDSKPVTYNTENGWSANASADVQRIGNAMMLTPEGKKIFDEMRAAIYGISLNYKEGFHSEDRNKMGEANIAHDWKGNVTGVTINLFDGKIQEDVAEYQKASQQGYRLQNPTEKQQLLLDQVPTMTERIGQAAAHEGTHATNQQAMPFKVGRANAERTANAAEMTVIRQTSEFARPIRPVFHPLILSPTFRP